MMTTMAILGCLALAGGSGCQSQGTDDPMGVLGDASRQARLHLHAMEQIDIEARAPGDDAGEPGETGDMAGRPRVDEASYLKRLHAILWTPGYAVAVRAAALDRLADRDAERLHAAIDQGLPQLADWEWLVRLHAIIAERNWQQHTDAIIRSWSRPTQIVADEIERPEYQALATMYGEAAVLDVLFATFATSSGSARQGLRTRTWELLHRLGERPRLLQLLRDHEPSADDLLLADLHRAARELDIVPHNREEILWVRQLMRPEYSAFRREAAEVVASLASEPRNTLALRDLAIVVSAARHDPDLLSASQRDLYERIDRHVRDQQRHRRTAEGVHHGLYRSEWLNAHRDDLTWGDLAAMAIVLRALDVPQVVDHLFDYAERDMTDESTEYGGLIELDDNGRFAVLEFLPRIRRHDAMFIAPPEMFERSYTAIAHMHFHAQQYRNAEYAGPGDGDLAYADSTRANCLVLTFIDEDRMNVDFYRHDGVIVDLGEMHRRQPNQ